MLEERLAGHHEAIVWPDKTAEIPHEDQRFLIAYMPLEFGGKPAAWQKSRAKEFFETFGDKPRKFKNGLAIAVPAEDHTNFFAGRCVTCLPSTRFAPRGSNST